MKFYHTVPLYVGKDSYPTGETAVYEFDVPEDKLSKFNKWLDENGLMVKKGTDRIISKPKKGLVSLICDFIKDRLSD